MSVLDQIMGTEEAAELWGISQDHVKRLCREGVARSRQIGKTWILERDQPNPAQPDHPKNWRHRRMDELKKFEDRFEDITDWSKSSDYRKDERLAELMTEMERTFRIPILNDEEYNKANPEVIALYRKISLARKLE